MTARSSEPQASEIVSRIGLPSEAVSVLWVIPLLCLTVGAVLVTSALRHTTRAAVALRDECLQLGHLRTALVDLREDADETRAAVARIRSRDTRPVDLG